MSRYSQYQHLHTSVVSTPFGFLTTYATQEGIKAIDFADTHPAEHLNPLCVEAKKQLSAYIQGTLREFDLPLAPDGTEFQQKVWQQLLSVPYGQTASYLDIATALHKPTACRAVGAANGKNPIPIIIPCHRIIGSNGSLTGYAGGLQRKIYLLNIEAAVQ